MNNLKIFACNSAEDFSKEICSKLGVSLRTKGSI